MQNLTEKARASGKVTSGVANIWLVLWGMLVTVGLLWMTAYSMSPGAEAGSLFERPADSAIPFSEDSPTLVAFLHPRCPCAMPSVAALGRLMARKHPIVVQPVFFTSGAKPKEWVQADYWEQVLEFGAHPPVVDTDGEIARKFHVTTSGHVILFSVDGRVLYSGGITSGRVHEGDNMGLTKLNRVLEGVPVSDPSFPVYGCSIIKKQVEHAH